ncbi:hypothetical protein DL95DRAFT_415427 [Leptodontidium sp. 2 PMI_412]|nr:hypothetical protein DL95DRAFT_415427 [Leptodontidium sp. 2 PMI_412]
MRQAAKEILLIIKNTMCWHATPPTESDSGEEDAGRTASPTPSSTQAAHGSTQASTRHLQLFVYVCQARIGQKLALRELLEEEGQAEQLLTGTKPSQRQSKHDVAARNISSQTPYHCCKLAMLSLSLFCGAVKRMSKSWPVDCTPNLPPRTLLQQSQSHPLGDQTKTPRLQKENWRHLRTSHSSSLGPKNDGLVIAAPVLLVVSTRRGIAVIVPGA